MPDLSELMSQLTPESAPQVDWDAPPPGTAPPAVYPGRYMFRFYMPAESKDWFGIQAVEIVKGQPKRNFLKIFYEAEAIADKDGNPLPTDADGKLPYLKFQNVSCFKTDKMPIHMAAELVRAMGQRITGDFTSGIKTVLEQLAGRAVFYGDVQWRVYFDSGTTVSTRPRKGRGDVAWPKEADGRPVMMVADPTTGQKKYGYAEIYRFYPVEAQK